MVLVFGPLQSRLTLKNSPLGFRRIPSWRRLPFRGRLPRRTNRGWPTDFANFEARWQTPHGSHRSHAAAAPNLQTRATTPTATPSQPALVQAFAGSTGSRVQGVKGPSLSHPLSRATLGPLKTGAAHRTASRSKSCEAFGRSNRRTEASARPSLTRAPHDRLAAPRTDLCKSLRAGHTVAPLRLPAYRVIL